MTSDTHQQSTCTTILTTGTFSYDVHFKNHELVKFISDFPEKSLIVEMYPLNKNFQQKVITLLET